MGEEKRIYYKVLCEDMYSTYQNFKYELSKTYTTNEEIEPCGSGFHACENMYELVIWCTLNNIKECRFFKCYLGNAIIKDIHKVVSDSITLIEEIPFEIIDKSIRDNTDKLINDKDQEVREAVADQGYGLETLIDDDDPVVRAAVAYQGYGLETLINDKDWYVRGVVAKQGYGLETLINDKNSYVRYVAKEKLKEIEE